MAVTVSARSSRGPSTPAIIRGAGLSAALGIALSITEYADLGKWITVLGVLLMIYGLHRYGRSGADAPIVFTLPPRKKKKKKKKKRARADTEPEPEAATESAASDADSESN